MKPGVGNVAKIDALMATARDAPPREQGASFRYLLCSTARCGSNLVSDMLQQTGLAGDPMEYLNARYIAGFLRLQPQPVAPGANVGTLESGLRVRRYLHELEKRRTTPNGHFGVKVHFEHMKALFRPLQNAQPFLAGFDRIVLLRRRDKLAQAVSLHKARVTQIWTSQDLQYLAADDPSRTRSAEIDAVAIAKALSDLVAQEHGWERLLRHFDLPFEIFWYEDWVANRQAEGRRLLAYLELQQTGAELKAPNLARQSQDVDPMLAAFRHSLGLE